MLDPKTTVGELMKWFPGGFCVGAGTPEVPGGLSRILAGSSHLSKIAQTYPFVDGNKGYLVVEIEDFKRILSDQSRPELPE